MTLHRLLIAVLLLVSPAAVEAQETFKPNPVHSVLGESDKYTPLGFTTGFDIRGRVEQAGGFEVDRYGTRFKHDPAFNTQLRLSLKYTSGKTLSPIFLGAEYEHDLYSGVVHGGSRSLGMVDEPGSSGYSVHQLRKAFVRGSLGPFLTVAAGFMTSHWGTGLIANDGNHGWQPGSAQFKDPRGGDRVLRAMVASGPHKKQHFLLFAAFDSVQGDDVLLKGDTAEQAILGWKMGTGKPYELGVYVVQRRQESARGALTRVGVADIYGRYTIELGADTHLTLEGEFAAITGQTDLGPSPDLEKHDVLQLATVAKADFNMRFGGVGLTIVFASGDQNFDDLNQNAFRADPNFELGLLLFRYVVAAQSARTPVTASDPDLVGVPSQDLERIPTRGSVTNTLAFFPRAWIRPMDGLDIYAGVLVALANVNYADAFNSRLAGGVPTNALNKAAGTYYGTEFDLGIRYTLLLGGMQMELGVEGALLLPGSALGFSDPLMGGRAMAGYRF